MENNRTIIFGKTKPSNTIRLLEKDKVVTDKSEISETLNTYLTNMVTSLSITGTENIDLLNPL